MVESKSRMIESRKRILGPSGTSLVKDSLKGPRIVLVFRDTVEPTTKIVYSSDPC